MDASSLDALRDFLAAQRAADHITDTARVYCALDAGGIFCGIDFAVIDGAPTDGLTVFAVPANEAPTSNDWTVATEVAYALGEILKIPVEIGLQTPKTF